MAPDALAAVARSVFLCWLLLPGIGIPLSLIAQRRGHRGFLPRLVPWFLVVLAVLIPAYIGAWAFLALVCVAGVASTWELVGVAIPDDAAAD